MTETFAAVLRRLREQHDFTQQRLAVRASLSHDSLQSWETGRRRPSLDRLKVVCIALELTPSEWQELANALAVPEPEPITPSRPESVPPTPIRPAVVGTTAADKLEALGHFFKDEPLMLEVSRLFLGDDLTAGQRAQVRDQLQAVLRTARQRIERRA